MAHCDVLVTHGGVNSVTEALSAGVPMVVIPIFADQPYSGLRVADLGVGQFIDLPDLTAERIRMAVRAVLDDDRYRTNARRLQAEMAALPGSAELVKLLVDLVDGWTGRTVDAGQRGPVRVSTQPTADRPSGDW